MQKQEPAGGSCSTMKGHLTPVIILPHVTLFIPLKESFLGATNVLNLLKIPKIWVLVLYRLIVKPLLSHGAVMMLQSNSNI